MKIVLEYDTQNGLLFDKNGMSTTPVMGLVGFEPEIDNAQIVCDLVEKGVKPDDIIKMKNAGLL